MFVVLVAILFYYWLFKKLDKVASFRMQILDKCIEWDNKHFYETDTIDDSSLCWCFDQLPSHNKMVFSFWKSLEMKNWIPGPVLDKLNS